MRRRDAGNFENWRTITAKRASSAAQSECGHPIQAGERIGFNHRTKAVKCGGCWASWEEEIDQARAMERGGY